MNKMLVEVDSNRYDVTLIDKIWIGDNGHIMINWNTHSKKLKGTVCYKEYQRIPAVMSY